LLDACGNEDDQRGLGVTTAATRYTTPPGFESVLQVGQRTLSVADTSGTGKGEVFAFEFGQTDSVQKTNSH